VKSKSAFIPSIKKDRGKTYIYNANQQAGDEAEEARNGASNRSKTRGDD
jgi:hypothetical protein